MMTLKKKLMSAFGGLVLFALLLAGLTFYVVNQWRGNEKRLADHYQRSLSLQRIRATTFRAFKEVPDAVTGDDPDSRGEFDALMKPVSADFEIWSKLAETNDEKAQVAEVRAALALLVEDANRAFTLVEAGDRAAATRLMENRLEDQQFVRFNRVTEKAVASDQATRQRIRAQNKRAQDVARVTLLGAAISTLILSMLLAAYLGTDLFAPLQTVRQALDDAAKGDKDARLDEERDDEIGTLNIAFNRLMESWDKREKALSLGGALNANGANANGTDADGANANGAGDGANQTTRVALHTLIARLRGRVAQLKNGETADSNADETADQTSLLLGEVDALLKAVERLADVGLPLDLNLAKTDVRGLLYDLMLRFQDQLLARGVNLEIECDEELQSATFDALKIREALGQCIKRALEELPERGGKIALRARLEELADGNELVMEVANDRGDDENAIDRTLGHARGAAEGDDWGDALQLARSIVEAHGGEMAVQSGSDVGTYVALRMPYRK